VRRHRDAADRRKVRVEITAHGVARLEDSRPAVLSAVAEVLHPLSLAERHSLRALLDKLALDRTSPKNERRDAETRRFSG
jgi:DNA-binding MarR family transcriptional regulator